MHTKEAIMNKEDALLRKFNKQLFSSTMSSV